MGQQFSGGMVVGHSGHEAVAFSGLTNTREVSDVANENIFTSLIWNLPNTLFQPSPVSGAQHTHSQNRAGAASVISAWTVCINDMHALVVAANTPRLFLDLHFAQSEARPVCSHKEMFLRLGRHCNRSPL